MNELLQKLSEYLDAAEGVIREYGPQAVDAALWVVRFDAIWNLVFGFLYLLSAAALGKLALKLVKRGIEEDEKGSSSGPVYFMGVFFSSLFSMILFIFGVATLSTVYYWIAAFDPAMGLVYRAAQSAGLL